MNFLAQKQLLLSGVFISLPKQQNHQGKENKQTNKQWPIYFLFFFLEEGVE